MNPRESVDLGPVDISPGTLCHQVSAGTGWPGVSILDETVSLICNFYLNVWQHVQ